MEEPQREMRMKYGARSREESRKLQRKNREAEESDKLPEFGRPKSIYGSFHIQVILTLCVVQVTHHHHHHHHCHRLSIAPTLSYKCFPNKQLTVRPCRS